MSYQYVQWSSDSSFVVGYTDYLTDQLYIENCFEPILMFINKIWFEYSKLCIKEERKGGGSICALELQYNNRDQNTRDESSNPSYGSETSLTPRNMGLIANMIVSQLVSN